MPFPSWNLCSSHPPLIIIFLSYELLQNFVPPSWCWSYSALCYLFVFYCYVLPSLLALLLTFWTFPPPHQQTSHLGDASTPVASSSDWWVSVQDHRFRKCLGPPCSLPSRLHSWLVGLLTLEMPLSLQLHPLIGKLLPLTAISGSAWAIHVHFSSGSTSNFWTFPFSLSPPSSPSAFQHLFMCCLLLLECKLLEYRSWTFFAYSCISSA